MTTVNYTPFVFPTQVGILALRMYFALGLPVKLAMTTVNYTPFVFPTQVGILKR